MIDLAVHPVIVTLPVGPSGPDGLPGKMGADDYIAAYGEAAFRQVIDQALQPAPQPRSLDDYRAELTQMRLDSVGTPGTSFDGSPAGAGKSFADIPAARKAGASLTVLPAHKNCRETEETYCQHGLNAAAYPELSEETCGNYREAVVAINAGLSASSAVCPTCSSSAGCEYRAGMEAAENAAHRIATHTRARLSFKDIAKGRPYIAIHEDTTDLLRPTSEITIGLEQVARVAEAAKLAAWDAMDLRHFFHRVEESARWLLDKLTNLASTTPLQLPLPANNPHGVDAKLMDAMKTTGVFPPGDTMRVCRELAAGQLAEVTIRVDRTFAKGGVVHVHKTIVAVWQTRLPEEATIWIADATGDPVEIATLAGCPVIDRTPAGRLEQQHPAIQIPIDIKQSSTAARVVKALESVLSQYTAQRIGVICHKVHVRTILGTTREGPSLPESLRRRIVKVEYYRSGEGRGSNHWIGECDLIIVLGTPRVPPSVIKTRLVQTGRTAAATRDGRWERDYWSGVTVSGKRRTIRTAGYRDRNWHQAHRSIVHAELHQAIGRGRGICPNGVPVVVVGNEPLGLPLADSEPNLVIGEAGTALRALGELTDIFLKAQTANQHDG